MDPASSRETARNGFWDPVSSNIVDCFLQYFELVLPHEPLVVVRLVGHFLCERLAWSNTDGTPRAPREVLRLAELVHDVNLDRKSIHSALEAACAARYLEPVALPEDQGGGYGFRIKLDLGRFAFSRDEFQGFYPVPTHRIKVPLAFFTTVVPRENLSVIKVVACVIRLTLGSIDNLASDAVPAISQQHFVRRMNMGRRQAIQGVQESIARRYIRRFEQGSLESGRPSTYGLHWREEPHALVYPLDHGLPVPFEEVFGKWDQDAGKKGSEGQEKGITGAGKGDQGLGKKGSRSEEKGITRRGKGDQGGEKKGSAAPLGIDLLDLEEEDLRSSSREIAPLAADSAPAPAEEDLIVAIKTAFPNGNPALVRRFLAERGTRYVHHLLDLLVRDEIDPAFVRRFTRSSDPRWAAFHTCCTTGQEPPRRSARPSATAPQLAPTPRRDDGWDELSRDERLATLLTLWRQVGGLYLSERPSADDEQDFFVALADAFDRGLDREALEMAVFDDISRRRGRPIAARESALR